MNPTPGEMKLKYKYLALKRPKFGGRKRSSGNSGGVGRVAKALKRTRVVHSRLRGSEGRSNQYTLWVNAGRPHL